MSFIPPAALPCPALPCPALVVPCLALAQLCPAAWTYNVYLFALLDSLGFKV